MKTELLYFGYKNHIAVDVKHKFIRKWQVSADVHDSQVFLEILSENTSRDVYADSAQYVSEATLQRLKALGYRAHLQRKGQKKQPLSAWEKQGNRRRSRIRSRVEHVFGAQL